MFAMNDADDDEYAGDYEDDEESDGEGTTDDQELTEDSFRREGPVDGGAPQRPQPTVPPIGLASQTIFSQAADRGDRRSPSAHNVTKLSTR